VDCWINGRAASKQLRQRYAHQPSRSPEFTARYPQRLSTPRANRPDHCENGLGARPPEHAGGRIEGATRIAPRRAQSQPLRRLNERFGLLVAEGAASAKHPLPALPPGSYDVAVSGSRSRRRCHAEHPTRPRPVTRCSSLGKVRSCPRCRARAPPMSPPRVRKFGAAAETATRPHKSASTRWIVP
jgi:hypothetical protein